MLNLTKDKRKSLGSFYTPDSLADDEEEFEEAVDELKLLSWDSFSNFWKKYILIKKGV